VILFTSHLRDDRLFECYLAVRAGEAVDPPSADHLADCSMCAARFDELTRFMNTLREDADAEVDELFSARRLAQQQQQIARRIEAVGRSARVIHFPTHAAPRQLRTAVARTLPRWVAATAAAGLFAGIAAGLFFDRDRSVGVPPMAIVQAGPDDGSEFLSPPAIVDRVDREDAFLSELEVAAGGPRTAELAAYDALTPHIREVSVSLPVR
jgi:hypothetical protein